MGRRLPIRGCGAFTLLVLGVALPTLTVPHTALPGPGPRVFSYVFDNGQDGIPLAYGRDGLKRTPLFGCRPVVAPTVGGGLMRDPYAVLGPAHVCHAAWTTGWYEQGIGIAHSRKRCEGVRSRGLKARTTLGDELQMPPCARRGGVCGVTDSILRGLLAAMPPAGLIGETDGMEQP
jgi:hypothetical protein